MNYKKVGEITHYFDHIQVAVLKVTEGSVKEGDTIRIGEEADGFEQKVESMQVDHLAVNEVKAGEEAGLKVAQKTKEGDAVYLVTE